MVTITTGNIRDIRHLREEGLNDQAISTKLGLSQTSVRRYRRKMGFPPTGRNKNQRMYTVWSAETDQLLCYGDAHECTEMLGLANVSIFYQTVSRTKAGRMKKYVFLVEPYEEEQNSREA
jgi:hypothetical protein